MDAFKEFVFGVLLLCLPIVVTAQPEIPDFGDIPETHWEINSFEGDTSLGAIVLFDQGHVEVTSKLNLKLKRHVRIKILSEKGYDWATVTIPYHDDRQGLNRPKAVSYNRVSEGEVTEKKLGRRDYFEEKIDDEWEQIKFTFPAIQPGTIIEYEYTKEFEKLADYPDWTFQRSIPTLVSYLHSEIPRPFLYTFYYQGVEPVDYQNSNTYKTSRTFRFGDNTAGRTRRVWLDLEMVDQQWAINNIPALEQEPFMSSLNNFKSKLFVQLNSIHYPNGSIEQILSSWGNVVESLNEHDNFGDQLDSSDEVIQTTKDVIEGAENDLEKMQQIYDYVAKSISWNDDLGFLADKSPEEVLRVKSGTGVEINLLLVQMLREAEIKANPVLLSTRSNGRVLTLFPIIAQFNHVICEAEVDGKSYYMDAKDKYRPYNLLPVSDLNGDALVIDGDEFRWVQLNRTAPSTEKYRIAAKMDSTGHLKGSFSADLNGYPALHLRTAFEEADKDYIGVLEEVLFEENSEIELDSLHIENRTSFEKVLKVKSDFSSSEFLNGSNEQFIYLNPMLLLREENNPFKLEERKYPIVFPSTFKKRLILAMDLPKGYDLDEVPRPRRIKLEKNTGVMTRIVREQTKAGGEKMLVLLYQIQFNKNFFAQQKYEGLKKFWTELVATHSDLVVLKKEVYDEQK